jgi:hypothetical protein
MRDHFERLQSIQAMLAAGHRCVELEWHSLLLWGLVGGGLLAGTDLAINAENFPDIGQRAVAVLVWLAFWVGGMSLLDHRLTRRARLARAETLPFAQAQVTRAWWMLLAIGTLATFAMFFHGGGIMIYALWTVLLGLGMFFFGLFSRPFIEWTGLATILLGIAGLTAGLPMGVARWLAASAFAIGLPAAGWLATRSDDRRPCQRLAFVALWLAAVVGPALAIAHLFPEPPPHPATATRKLPAGSLLPLHVDFDSRLVAIEASDALPMRLLRDTEIALDRGQPDGRYRFNDGPWHAIKDGVLLLRIDRIQPRLADDGQPEVRMRGSLSLHGDQP